MPLLVALPSTTLEPGDRFEVFLSADGLALGLPETFRDLDLVVDQVLDPSGRPLQAHLDDTLENLVLSPALTLPTGPGGPLWLEYQEPGRFRLISDKQAAEPVESAVDLQARLTLSPDDALLLKSAPRQQASLDADRPGPDGGPAQHQRRVRPADLPAAGARHGAAGTPDPHGQDRAAALSRQGHAVRRGRPGQDHRGRLDLRRAAHARPDPLGPRADAAVADRAVAGRDAPQVLAGADQPRRSCFQASTAGTAWNEFDFVIASIHTAKREPHRSAITGRHWDLLIVDEAHHLRNRNTQVWQLASELQKQYALLLTATPVQNNLEELFNLVTLAGARACCGRPGSSRSNSSIKKDKLTPRNLDELHRLLSEVMVRNRRSTVGLQFTRRWARTERAAAHCRRAASLRGRGRVSSGLHLRQSGQGRLLADGAVVAANGPGQLQPGGGRHPGTPGRNAAARRRGSGDAARPGRAGRAAGRELQGQPPAGIAAGISGQAGVVHAVPGDAGHAAGSACSRRGTAWPCFTAA